MASPVSKAMARGQWNSAIEIVQSDRSAAAIWAARPGCLATKNVVKEIPTNLHGLPIHEAACMGAPHNVVDAIARAHPEGLAKKDLVLRRLPLHWAAQRCPVDESVILMLLKYYKDSVEEADKLGRTPLHYAIQSKASVDVIQAMLDAHPNVAKAQDDRGYTPLHLCCIGGYPTPIIKSLLDLNPDAAIMSNEKGQTAAHCADLSNSTNKDEVLNLLKQYAIHANSQFKNSVEPSSRRFLV